MSFICMRMKNHSHIKGWALYLVLKQRPGGTRKWPINTSVLPRVHLWISLNLDNFENGVFFHPFSLPFTRKRRFRAPETQDSQNGSPGRRFKKASLSFICGRTKQAVFDVVHHILLVLRMRCKGCYCISIVLAFSCGLAWTNQTRYLWTREKNSVFKNIMFTWSGT